MRRDAPWLLDEDEAVEAYRATDAYTLDAINEFATWAPEALPPTLLGDILAWFETTDCFATVIEDIREGNREP